MSSGADKDNPTTQVALAILGLQLLNVLDERSEEESIGLSALHDGSDGADRNWSEFSAILGESDLVRDCT
jgi:hypothetical protein